MARILIVEDNLSVAQTVGILVGTLGYESVVVGTGAAAISELSGTTEFDLVILDWMLPDTTGLGILRHLSSTHHRTGLPVIIVTAKDDPDVAASGLMAGADDFITKPFDPRELEARIRSVTRRYRARRQDIAEGS